MSRCLKTTWFCLIVQSFGAWKVVTISVLVYKKTNGERVSVSLSITQDFWCPFHHGYVHISLFRRLVYPPWGRIRLVQLDPRVSEMNNEQN